MLEPWGFSNISVFEGFRAFRFEVSGFKQASGFRVTQKFTNLHSLPFVRILW